MAFNLKSSQTGQGFEALQQTIAQAAAQLPFIKLNGISLY